MMLLLSLSIVTLTSGVSVLWIYTGGHLDQKSIERALPVIQRDFDTTYNNMASKAELVVGDLSKSIGPYAETARTKAEWLWEDLKRRNDLVAFYINKNYGPTFCWMKKSAIEGFKTAQIYLQDTWVRCRPYFQQLGEIIIYYAKHLWAQIEFYAPIVMETVCENAKLAYNWAQNTVQGLMS